MYIMLEEKLREAALADEHTREHIIRDLASHADEILPTLIHRLQYGPKGGTERMAARVIHAISYPGNQSAIPALIDRVGDLNAPVWNEAVQALLAMPAAAVVPTVIGVLLDRGQHVLYWGEAVNGMCAMITSAGASRDLALRCGPVIAYLLSQECAASVDQLCAAGGNQRPGPRGTGTHRLIQPSLAGALSVCAAFARYGRTLNDTPGSGSIARRYCSITMP